MKNKNGIKKATRFLMLCFFFVAVSIGAYAQKTVTGKVVDEGGLPLPGVSIIIKGTTTGTVTGIDGDFSLSNVSNDATLLFSFVGMTPQEVLVGTQSGFDIKMISEAIGLDEVVAIGYGTQKKANLTGAVGVATAERLENRPIASVGHGIQGVIPNLNVTIRNGDPTTTADYNIRGYESINGGNPLILVDGVPMNMDDLNPNDVASITVLKDAASSAIYGARAAFGVILVETKKGKMGKVKVTLSTEQSLAKPIYLIDPETDPYAFVTLKNQANMRTNGANQYDDDYVTKTKAWSENPTEANAWGVVSGTLRYYGFNNYHDQLIANFAPQDKYDMSISGATEKASYYVSFGYLNKDGYLENDEKNENYKRYNVLMKMDFKINDWLSLDEKIMFTSERSNKPHFYNWDVNINTSARMIPIQPLKFPDLPYYMAEGDHDKYKPYIGMDFASVNFVPYLEQGGRETYTSNDSWFTQGINLTPLKGLLVRGDFSYQTYWRNYEDVQSKIYVVNDQSLTNTQIGNGFSGDDWINNQMNYNQYYVANAFAEYTLDQIDNHYVKAMVGFSEEWGRNTYIRAQARQLITPLITDLNATVGTQQTFGGKSHVSLRSIFYRLNYIYKDKYLLEANGRYDGTSRFGTDDRFGFFPSVSVGWRISNEGFMEGTRGWLDNLKLRASYGELGNQTILNSDGSQNWYPYISTMGSGQAGYVMSSGNIPYVSPSGLVSPTLTWETVATKNIGLDFTALNQRLDLSFDVYTRDTKNMLMSVTYPEILGTSAPQENAADLRTNGWELQANWHDVIGDDWQYGVTVVLADNQSEITKYNNPTGAFNNNNLYVGRKLGEIWGFETEGIFQTAEEITAHASQAALGAAWRPGDIMYKDQPGVDGAAPDGKITYGNNTLSNPGDQIIIGNTSARYTFGINPDVSYKNWTLNVFFQGLQRDYLPPNDNWNAFYPFNAGHVEKYYATDTWSVDNPDAYFAAPHISTSTKQNILPQTRYIQNASYIRLKNLTLNYNLPLEWISKAGLSRAQIYFSGEDMWEFSNIRKPLHPEVATVTQEYYLQRIYTLGIKVTF
jgi:TonB-linked SusC/RagA family outer membrane protein